MRKNNIKQAAEVFDIDEYARNMRKDLSNPDIFQQDGQLNHSYFLTKKGQYWSEKNELALKRGLELFGVGNWTDINSYEFSDKANVVELELRTCIILGINDISEYQGQKLPLSQQQEIQKSNLAKGKKENRLKDNIYLKVQGL